MLYGSLLGAAGARVSVRLASTDGAYVRVFNATAAADLTWRVLLEPMPAGGNFSARAECAAGCAPGSVTEATLSDLTFGDVVFCAGQSNVSSPASPPPSPSPPLAATSARLTPVI